MGHATDRGEQQAKSNADSPVVVDTRGVAEQPTSEDKQDHWQRKREPAKEPTDRVVIKHLSPGLVVVEPLHNDPGNSE